MRGIILVVVFLLFVHFGESKNILQRNDKQKFGHLVQREATKRDDPNTCTTISCAKSGDSCASTFLSLPECVDNTYCNSTTEKCTQYQRKKYGSPCQVDDECEGTCINNICNSYYNPGTPCTSAYQCYYSVDYVEYTSCVNKRCAGIAEGDSCDTDNDFCLPPLTCGPDSTCIQPRDLGETCASDVNCAKLLRCNNNTCVNPLQTGDPCDLNNDLCGGTTLCTPTNENQTDGICIEILTQGVGAFCSQDEHCAEELFCNMTTCARTLTSSNDPCSNDSMCSDYPYQTCSCDGIVGQTKCLVDFDYIGNPTGLKKATSDLYSCQISNCLETNTLDCVATHCKTQSCNYALTLNDGNLQKYYSQIYPKCYVDYIKTQYHTAAGLPGYFTCGGHSLSASILFIFVALFLALL